MPVLGFILKKNISDAFRHSIDQFHSSLLSIGQKQENYKINQDIS